MLPFRPMMRHRCLAISIVGACILHPLASTPSLHSQAPGGARREHQIRVGVLFGGTSLLGLITEYQRGDWSAELILGTFGPYRGVFSAALTAKRYFFSDGDLRPALGGGLWGVAVRTDEGLGSLLTLRLPVALDWNFRGGHALGLEVGFNRALAVTRVDPEDDTPPRSRIVPFPGTYYRYGWSP